MAYNVLEPHSTTPRLDDCWNRIGTRGDGSCPRLAELSRCANCAVFEQAAATLLDRPVSDPHYADDAHPTYSVASPEGVADRAADAASAAPATHSALVFRVVGEWLALPTAALRQVDHIRPVHALPHRRNPVVLGLVNIRGVLTVAASLVDLLNLDRTASGKVAPRAGYARMLVAEHRGEPVVFPVHEVEGLLRFAPSALLPPPATFACATTSHARGVLAWRGMNVGLLDADRVFDSVARSLR